MSSLYDVIKNKALHLATGAIEGTVADSHTVNRTSNQFTKDHPYLSQVLNYRPAIVDQPGALYGIIQSVGHAVAPSIVDEVAPNSFAANSMDRSNAASDRTHQTLGVTQPQDWTDQAAEIAGGLLLPGPKVPGVQAATRLGKIANKVGQVAAETALPMRNTGIKTALATQVPLALGVREVVAHATHDPNYDPLIGDKPKALSNDPFDPNYTPHDLATSTSSDPFSPNYVPQHHIKPAIQDLNADNHDLTTLQKAMLGTAVVASAGLVAHMGASGIKKVLGSSADISDSLTGAQVGSTRASATSRVMAGVMQHDQIARNTAEEFLTPDQAARFKFNSDRLVPQAIGAKVRNAITTGQLPGSSVTVKPLVPMLQAMEQELNPVERQMVSNSLLAKTALEDARNNNNVRAAFNDKTDAELQQMVSSVESDPKLAKYADMVREHNRALLRYRADPAVGLITPEQYQEAITTRPNYVHLSKDKTYEGAASNPMSTTRGSSMLDESFARGTEERTGVQFGQARDPIDDLMGRYAATIRMGEVNSVKRQFFDDLINSSAARENVLANDGTSEKLIKEFTEKPNDDTHVHTVWDGGRARYYRLGDASLDRSLQYAPKATVAGLGAMRQVAQQATTGIGNPLFATTQAPAYDTMASLFMRPAGQQLGMINEALNRIGVPDNAVTKPLKFAISYTDPTTYLAAPINAIRRAGDELTGSMANSLATRLLKDHDWLVDALGQQKAENFRDMLQSHYKSSILSQMEQAGISSHQAYGADSGRTLPIGLHDLAPDYLSGASSRAWQQAVKGNAPAYRKVLETMKQGGRLAMDAPVIRQIANLYEGVARNMQEGTRYGYYATNRSKVRSLQDWEELASQSRRIATDPGQYGNSDYWNKLADSAMYANVGVQSLGQLAQRAVQGKGTFLANTLATISAATALRYAALFNDPDSRQRMLDKTDVQNASSMSLPGGIELGIMPEMRMMTAPLWATLDHLSGVSDGNFNPNFVQAINALMDDHSPEDLELANQAVSDATTSAISGVAPILPSSIPAVGAIEASQGIDPVRTRLMGQPSAIQEQRVSGLGGDGKTTDSFMSAHTGAIIQALTGSSVLNAIDAADQWHRAMYAQNANGTRGTSPLGAIKVGMSVIDDNNARITTPLHGMLFGGYEKLNSIAKTDYNLYQAKDQGIKQATEIVDKDIKHKWITGDPRYALMRPIDIVPPNLAGTPLGKIAMLTLPLNKQLATLDKKNAQLVKAIEDVKNQKTTTIQDRNKQINEYNKKRGALYSDMLRFTHITEDRIGQAIGDDSFTFQNFDPSSYASSSVGPQP